MLKQHEIKVPQNISVYYFSEKNILIVKYNNNTKIIKLKLKILLQPKHITILPEYIDYNIKTSDQYIKSLQGSVCSVINNSFMEITSNFYKKLKIMGVGYKVFLIKTKKNSIIHLKLGFSHSIYVKIPEDISVKNFKTNKLIFTCKNLVKLTALTSILKACKKPDSYKAKGISFDNEKIILKIGKVV